jgi:hypothetical protein
VDDITVLDVNVWRADILPGESVFHPVLVVTLEDAEDTVWTWGTNDVRLRTDLWVVLTSVSTAGLLASGGGSDGLDSTLENVTELEGLHEVTICASALRCSSRSTGHVRIPDHASVFDTNVLEGIVNVTQLLNALIQTLLGAVMGMHVSWYHTARTTGGRY